MRLALISDIHGNLVALEAVLKELADAKVDRILCLGDLSAGGSQPREALARVQSLGCTVIMGNTDEDLIELKTELPEWIADVVKWNREQLSEADRQYIRTFEPFVEIPLDGGVDLLCYHGSPRSNKEHIRPSTPDADLESIFEGHQATVFAGAHTHIQMFRRWGASTVINPGSVGFAWEKRGAQVMATRWAEYAVLTVEEGRLAVELRRTPYDFEELRRVTLATGMPHAERWLSNWTQGIRPGA